MEPAQSHETIQVRQKINSNWLLGAGLVLLLITAAFFSGIYFSSGFRTVNSMEAGLFSFLHPKTQPVENVSLDEFWRVWHTLEEKFVIASSTEEISTEDRLEGAISGLVRSYEDPYTVFLPLEEAERFDEDISGNFSGVGMEVGIRDNLVTIISPLPDTPAENAGLLAGDIITSIDSTATDGMSIDEAVRLIRGEKGTDVTLTIYRDGSLELQEIVVTRDTIAIPTTKTAQFDDVFVISLYSFNAIAEQKLKESLVAYAQSGADKLVLDLRGNPGGYLESAVNIASYFLPAGKVVVRESFGDGRDEEQYRSVGRNLGKYQPTAMVVLVNGGSASASEILAGALKEHGAATVIGAQTFGKGSVQELIDLPTGSSLKVTVARWLTPEGNSISDGGLAPDIKINRTVEQVIAEEDPQLDAALKFLAGEEVVSETASSTTKVVE